MAIKIYTAGKMAGLSYQEQMCWRLEVESAIRNKTSSAITFIHPPQFYTYGSDEFQSEKEVKDWELNQIRNCDIVIVNLNGINTSVGTHFELSTVDSMNAFGNKHIFVIGVGNSETPLHPWIESSLFRKEKTFEDVADYITRYLLV